MINFTVENTGYNNHQVVTGYMEINLDGFDESIMIDVAEVTTSAGINIIMSVDLDCHSIDHEKLIDVLKLVKMEDDTYNIIDEDIIRELFLKYGNNNSEFN